ncbi:MAG: hypothetical protein ACYS21_09165, partial [Planctomycetota bacterium]
NAGQLRKTSTPKAFPGAKRLAEAGRGCSSAPFGLADHQWGHLRWLHFSPTTAHTASAARVPADIVNLYFHRKFFFLEFAGHHHLQAAIDKTQTSSYRHIWQVTFANWLCCGQVADEQATGAKT